VSAAAPGPCPYVELVTDILRSKVKLFGDLALKRAAQVPGLDVLPSGDVRLDGNRVQVLEQLVATFEQLSGRTSTLSAKVAVARLRLMERFPGLELPRSLR
jgi:hypothetical protein